MAQQRLLFVDAEKLVAYRWKSGDMIAEGEFVADQAGLAAFADYLEQRRGSQFALLADVRDEVFQSESLPYVRGRDRDALLKRKLGQVCYGTPYSAAIPQGREKTGRRDENFLFVALTKPQQFEPWFGALRNNESQLAGFYSMPMMAAPFLDTGKATNSIALLISLTRGGLRQTFFERGRLRFSRLAPLVTNTIEEAASAVAAESAKLYQYLAGLELISPGTALPIKVLVHPADSPCITAHCRDTEELHYETIDLLAKSRQAGLKTLPTDSHSELLFLHLLAKAPPRQQLAALWERHYFRLRQLRFAINTAAAMVALACVLWSGKQLFEAVHLEEVALQIQAQNVKDREHYDALMATLPPLPVSADSLRALVGRFEELEKRSPSLAASYVRISKALQDAPKIELESIDWRISDNFDDSLQTGIGNAGMANPAAAGSSFAIADIYGLLPIAMVGDQRALLDSVNAFADHLRMDKTVQVRVLNMPFDVDSSKTIRSDSTAEVAASTPHFSLRLVQAL